MPAVVKRWQPNRKSVVVAHNSVAVLDVLDAVPQAVTVATRLRLDAALYEPAPIRQGKRSPTLEHVLTNPQTIWKTIEG